MVSGDGVAAGGQEPDRGSESVVPPILVSTLLAAAHPSLEAVDSPASVVITDDTGRIEAYNDAAASAGVLALTAPLKIGDCLYSILPSHSAAVHKQLLQLTLDGHSALRPTPCGERENSRTTVVVLLHGQLSEPKRFAHIVMDGTAHCEEMGELQARAERYRVLFEEASDGVFISNRETFRFEYVNARACELVGYTRDEFLKMTMLDLLAPFEATRFREKASSLLVGRRLNDWHLCRKNGSTFPSEISTTIFSDGRLQGIVRDISQRKAFEAGVLAARDAAERANKAKSQFLANVSHEIRTPLNGIAGITDLLFDGDLTESQRELVGMLRSSTQTLTRVMNDILDLSVLDVDRADHNPMSIRTLIQQVIGMFSAQAQQQSLGLSYHVEDSVPEMLTADARHIRQVLMNLLSNAVKFTLRGEVAVRANTSHTQSKGLLLHLEVKDTGIGIAQDKLSVIFAPFVQVDPSSTRAFGGLGLGLALCSQSVGLMGGRLWVESVPGKGSTFFAELPVSLA